jgi:DNA-binding LytR/AlgR family response regulator
MGVIGLSSRLGAFSLTIPSSSRKRVRIFQYAYPTRITNLKLMETILETKSIHQALLVEEIHKGRVIKHSDILYIEAQDNYSMLYLVDNDKVIVSRTLKSFEEELNSSGFIRCHKSYMVNGLYIKEYMIKKSEFILILQNQMQLIVARRRISMMKRFLHKNENAYPKTKPYKR